MLEKGYYDKADAIIESHGAVASISYSDYTGYSE